MSTNHQLDLHPDAESLSAFAEHQLPEHERQPILAHLATCARCREILFLAQDSVGDAQPAISGPVLLPSEKKPLANWRYAWGALAACAALATISIVFYPRHHVIPQQQAKVVAPLPIPATSAVAPQSEEKKQLSRTPTVNRSPISPGRPANAPAPKPATGLDFAVASPPPGQAATQPPAPQQQAAAGASTTLNITLKPAQSSQTVEVQAADQPLAKSEAETVNVAADSAQIQQETPPVTATMNAQVVQPTDQLKLKSRSVQPPGAMHPAPNGTAASGGTGNGMSHGLAGSIHGGAAGRPVASAGAPAKSPAAFAKMAPRPLAVTPEDEAAAHNVLGKTLPSGLAAIAAASASHHLLAIDSAGALFLSEDAGDVWEPVSAQWTGRAVQILAPQAAPALTNGMAIAGKAAADASSQPAPAPSAPFAPLFEIVTDQGVHWTSGDGRIWKTK